MIFPHQCGGVVKKNTTYIRLFSQYLYRKSEREKKYIDDLFSCECGIVGDRDVESYFLCTSLSLLSASYFLYSRFAVALLLDQHSTRRRVYDAMMIEI